MLKEKIQQVKQETNRKRDQQLLIMGAVGLVVIAFIAGITLLKFPEEDTTRLKVEEKKQTVISLSVQEIENLRSEFKEALAHFDGEIQPLIEVRNLEGWDKEKAFDIQSLKDKAVSGFTSGEYKKAIKNIQDGASMAEEAIRAQQSDFETAKSEAMNSYHADDYDLASINIDKALAIFPDDEQANALKHRIDTLPQILPMLEEARVTQVENNPEKEFQLLSQINKLDSARTEVTQRLQELEVVLKNILFHKSIELAMYAIDDQKASMVRKHLKDAKAIYPGREEIRLINGRLLKLESKIRLTSALKNAAKAAKNDDWAKVKSYFERSKKEDPAHKEASQGLDRANEILRLKKTFTEFQNNLYSLSVASYKKKALADLVKSEKYGNYSYSLTNQAADLNKLLDKMNKKQKVFVVSDNQTFVKVRGVGQVGLTPGRSIKLKPGNYTFEGSRKGYKSKLVKVLIPLGQNNTEVTMICDEPI